MKKPIAVIMLCLIALGISSCGIPSFSKDELEKAVEVQKNLYNKSENPEIKQSKQVILPAYIMDKGVMVWGFVDNSGAFVVKPQFEWISDLQEGEVYKFSKGGMIGLAGRDGKIIMEPAYNYILDFSEGLAPAVKDSGDMAVIDKKGNVVFEYKGSLGMFHEGMSVLVSKVGDSYLYGYINKYGKVIIQPEFLQAFDFKNGRALVKYKDGIYAIIDKSGKAITELDYYNISAADGDYLIFTDDSGFSGYIDYDGKKISNVMFKEARPFADGYAAVGVSTGSNDIKFGVIDKKGNFVIQPQFGSIQYIGEGMFAAAEKPHPSFNDLFVRKAIVDKEGKILSDYRYFDIGGFLNGVSSVSDGVSTYFIDNKGKMVDSLPRVDGAGVIKIVDDVCKVEVDNEVYYLSKDGKPIWKPDTTIKLSDSVSVKSLKYRPDRGTLIYYPEISGLTDRTVENNINSHLKIKFIEDYKASIADDSIIMEEVNLRFSASNIKNLLVLEKQGYFYPIGAAHPMPLKVFFHIDTNTGKFYSLSDLFKKDSNYQKILSDIVKEKINQNKNSEDYMYFEDTVVDIKDDQQFIIASNGIKILFKPYEIAPYAAGFPEFDISYSQIDEMINKDGEFWKSFNE